jgi:DNA mismatch endonuclease (patch repair protein)
MAAIKGKNTLPEKALRSGLFALGLRFRLHARGLPGSPDLVFPKYRAVVFVHGCFWHRHPGCRFTAVPKNNAEFWANKFSANLRRDQVAVGRLHELGWRVAVVWECAVRASPQDAAQLLRSWLRSGQASDIAIGGADVGRP